MKEKVQYVSNNLRSYRSQLGYTQEQMAKLLKVS